MRTANTRTAAFARRTALLAAMAVFCPSGGQAGAALLPGHVFDFVQSLFEDEPISGAAAAIPADFTANPRANPAPAGLAILGLSLATLGALHRRATPRHTAPAA